MITVSLIVPQYGKSDFTVTCIRSFLSQHQVGRTKKFMVEIIVVDDGSHPPARRALHDLPRGDLRIVTSSQNLGVTHAWNQGLAAARGEIAVLLNNDIISNGRWLQQLIAPLRKDPTLICGTMLRQEPDLPHHIKQQRGNMLLLEGWCFAFHRPTALQQIGIFDEQMRLYFSDTDWQCRWIQTFGPKAVQCMRGLPLEHLAHVTTNDLTCKRAIWNADRTHFLAKWNATYANDPSL